jgi:hypothetical protein
MPETQPAKDRMVSGKKSDPPVNLPEGKQAC